MTDQGEDNDTSNQNCDDLFRDTSATLRKDESLPLDSQQAIKIIAKFGGVPDLVLLLDLAGYQISRYSVYKWTYPKIVSGRGGTGGIIPAESLEWVKKAAIENGIELTEEDLKP